MSTLAETLAKWSSVWNEARAEERLREEERLNGCDYQTRLAVAAWVFKALNEHMREGGTYRYLIYHRLGFAEDAYVPLYEAGGMNLSNALQPPEPAPPPERGDG